MFKHQPGHLSIMNTGHEINLTAILDLHVPLTFLFSFFFLFLFIYITKMGLLLNLIY